ncbi:MAG: response regulator [Deltaproteobacteria bacterium]|nr:response regulator [Deltaproteobacteria bacterium]
MSDIRALIERMVEGQPAVTPEMVENEADCDRRSILEGLLSLSRRQQLLEARNREAEDELKESNRFLDSIVENLPNMVFVKDAAELRFVRVNRAAEALLGYSHDALIGKCDHDFFPKAQADFFVANDRAVLAKKELVDIPEEPIHTRYQGVRILHTKKIPILGQDGQPLYLLGLSEDITERHATQVALDKARIEAERAKRARSVFLGQMGHELRTPVTGIIGVARALLDLPTSPAQESRIKLIKNAAETLLRILDDILIFSRLDAHSMALREEDFDLRLSIDECMSLMRVDAERKGLGVSSTVATNVPVTVRGDGLRVRQILTNLLENATKFTNAGHIELACEAAALTDSEVVLHFSVADTGIGIARENMATIFEAFRQLDPPVPRPGPQTNGSGLGLSICAHLVELMRGRIWVDSDIGRGTTVHFTVRLRRAEGASPSDTSDSHSVSDSSRARRTDCPLSILVAEDDAVNGRAVMDLLEQLGHRSEWVGDGLSAVEREGSKAFDLILMDIRLPKLSGIEATRAIRTREREGNDFPTPIVALTAYASERDEAVGYEAGMNAIIRKPIGPSALSDVIAQLCRPSSPGRARARALDGSTAQPESTIARDELVAIFLRTIPPRLRTLKQALEGAERRTVEDTAHMVAGAAANIGADEISQLARSIEVEARDGHLERARASFRSLMQEFEVRFAGRLEDEADA